MFACHLPEDVVDGVAQESFSVVRRQEFGSQYRHKFLKVYLAVACRQRMDTHTHTQRQTATHDIRRADGETGSLELSNGFRAGVCLSTDGCVLNH